MEVDAAIGKMKQGKSGGSTGGVVSEMIKAAGETGTLEPHYNTIVGVHKKLVL